MDGTAAHSSVRNPSVSGCRRTLLPCSFPQECCQAKFLPGGPDRGLVVLAVVPSVVVVRVALGGHLGRESSPGQLLLEVVPNPGILVRVFDIAVRPVAAEWVAA